MLRWPFRLESNLNISLNNIQFIGIGKLARLIIEHLGKINKKINGLIIDSNLPNNRNDRVFYYQLFDQKIYNYINKFSGSINQEAINTLIKQKENEIKKTFISNLHTEKISIWIADLGSTYANHSINILKGIYDKMFTGFDKHCILILNLPLANTYKSKTLAAYKTIDSLSKSKNNILCINDINKYISNYYIHNIGISLNYTFNPITEIIDCLVSQRMFNTFNEEAFYKTPQRIIFIPINRTSGTYDSNIFTGEELLLINRNDVKIDHFTIQSENIDNIKLKDIVIKNVINTKKININTHNTIINIDKIKLLKSWLLIRDIPLSTLETYNL